MRHQDRFFSIRSSSSARPLRDSTNKSEGTSHPETSSASIRVHVRSDSNTSLQSPHSRRCVLKFTTLSFLELFVQKKRDLMLVIFAIHFHTLAKYALIFVWPGRDNS
jgi:hypothetical protein